MMMESKEETSKHQIPEQLDLLNNELSSLEVVVKALVKRLQPVIRVEVLEDAPMPKEEQENLVDLANCIRDNRARITGVVADIQATLELLEL